MEYPLPHNYPGAPAPGGQAEAPAGAPAPGGQAEAPAGAPAPSGQAEAPAGAPAPSGQAEAPAGAPQHAEQTIVSYDAKKTPKNTRVMLRFNKKRKTDEKQEKNSKKQLDLLREKRYTDLAKAKSEYSRTTARGPGRHDGRPLIRDGPMDDGRKSGRRKARQCFPRIDGRREKPFARRGLRRTRKTRISRTYSPLTDHIKRGPSLHGSTA